MLDLLHNLHLIRNDLQSDKTCPTETLTTASHPPTDAFQHHGQRHLLNQCPRNINADAFKTNYHWGRGGGWCTSFKAPLLQVRLYFIARAKCNAPHLHRSVLAWLSDTLTKKPPTSHQRKAISPQWWQSVMCGSDWCHVPLIMVMIAMGDAVGCDSKICRARATRSFWMTVSRPDRFFFRDHSKL